VRPSEQRTADGAGVPVRAVTRGPGYSHFFGYYEKTPWSGDGRRLLALRTDVEGRMPAPGDATAVVLLDLSKKVPISRKVAETTAWNWQQGPMLQWLPGAPNTRIVYNDRLLGRDLFVAVVRDLSTGEEGCLPRPVYAVSHAGDAALSLDFVRLAACRPTTGYPLVREPEAVPPAPDGDGVWRMDLATGDAHLLLSFARLVRAAADAGDPGALTTGGPHWVEHLMWAPGDARFLFLLRRAEAGGLVSHLFTADSRDGSDLRHLCGPGVVSHFDWRTQAEIVAWAQPAPGGPKGFFAIEDREGGAVTPVGEGVLTADGHCSFSPDRRWMLTDAYPDAERRSPLLLYRWSDGARFDLGRFTQPPELTGHCRCDLHPRWSRDGRQVCIDSAHEGGRRQMYVLDVSAIVGGAT